jgi:glycosyltransferase involved in cell wall biosynthesis
MKHVNDLKLGWVTVIIPTYNRAHLIENTIQSVFDQTYPYWNLIVIDDGSTDDTAQVVKKSDHERLAYLPIPHSGLPAVARNKGMKIAKGEYLAFLDSDDQWLPVKLERQIAVFKGYSDVGLIHANAYVKNEQQFLDRLYHTEYKRRSGTALLELIHSNYIITSTVVVRRSLFDVAGFFPINPALRSGEDYDLWLRMAALSDFYYLDNVLAIYHDEPNYNIRAELSEISYWQMRLLIFERFNKYLKSIKRKYCHEHREINKNIIKFSKFLISL